jgi:hypothetical protein
LVLFLIPLQFVCWFCNLSECILLFFSFTFLDVILRCKANYKKPNTEAGLKANSTLNTFVWN